MMLLALSLLLLAAWAYLALFRLSVFRSLPRLGAAAEIASPPEVAVVIPARNEEATIGSAVAALFASDYAGALSVIVVDDHSTDATAEQAKAFAPSQAGEENRTRLSVIPAPPLRAGWTGKLNAVAAGLEHARTIAPEAPYVLFTDADIALAPETLRRLVAQAENSGAALVSLMARLDARGVWGGLLIPPFVFFFQKLYPFHRVNEPRDRIAAAAGGCMLARRAALEAIGGAFSIKGRLIDDCALASAIKQHGERIWIGPAQQEAVSLRDNRSFRSVWRMVARSAFTQLDHSYARLVAVVAGMLVLYLAPPAVALAYPWHGQQATSVIALAAWLLMATAYFPTARLYDQAPFKTLLLPVAAFFFTLMTIGSAADHARGKGGAWKGRVYPA